MGRRNGLVSVVRGLDARRARWAARQADRIVGDQGVLVTPAVAVDGTIAADRSARGIHARNIGRLLVNFRLVGAVLVGLANLSKARELPEGSRFAAAEVGVTLGTVAVNTWLRRVVDAADHEDPHGLDGALAIDAAAAAALNLATALASPPGVLGHGSAATFHTAVGGPFVWSSVHSVGAGLAVTLEGLVTLLAMARINRSQIQTDAGLNPLWGLVGVVFVGHTTALLNALVDKIAAARHDEARARERIAAADWLHDHTIQSLATLLDAEDTPRPVADVLRREHDRLRAWHEHAADRVPDHAVALHEALGQQVRDLQHEGFAIELSSDDTAMAGALVAAVAGAVREALHNAARHSGSDRAVVAANTTGGTLAVTIRDYGRGLPFASAADRPAGRGMDRSIFQRVEAVGGTVEVRPRRPGTEVRITLPHPEPTP